MPLDARVREEIVLERIACGRLVVPARYGAVQLQRIVGEEFVTAHGRLFQLPKQQRRRRAFEVAVPRLDERLAHVRREERSNRHFVAAREMVAIGKCGVVSEVDVAATE